MAALYPVFSSSNNLPLLLYQLQDIFFPLDQKESRLPHEQEEKFNNFPQSSPKWCSFKNRAVRYQGTLHKQTALNALCRLREQHQFQAGNCSCHAQQPRLEHPCWQPVCFLSLEKKEQGMLAERIMLGEEMHTTLSGCCDARGE